MKGWILKMWMARPLSSPIVAPVTRTMRMMTSGGHPARAKVVDDHGQAHYVMIEPHDDGEIVAQGETALLVRKQGQIFFAVADSNSKLRAI